MLDSGLGLALNRDVDSDELLPALVLIKPEEVEDDGFTDNSVDEEDDGDGSITIVDTLFSLVDFRALNKRIVFRFHDTDDDAVEVVVVVEEEDELICNRSRHRMGSHSLKRSKTNTAIIRWAVPQTESRWCHLARNSLITGCREKKRAIVGLFTTIIAATSIGSVFSY